MGDLIRRSDILESLGDRPENWTDSAEEIQACADWDAFHGIVTRLPAVDAVEVVHGEWIIDKTFGSFACSICGSWHAGGFDSWRSPYCPKCGAKMDGKEEHNAAD